MIILPGRHFLRPTPTSRLRARTLERLLAGRQQFALGGLGCNCCGSGPPTVTCGACSLSSSTVLTVSDSIVFPGGLSANYFPDLGVVLSLIVFPDGSSFVLNGIPGWATDDNTFTCVNGVVTHTHYFVLCSGSTFTTVVAWNGVIPPNVPSPGGWDMPFSSYVVMSQTCSPLTQVVDATGGYNACLGSGSNNSVITWSE